MRFQTLFRTSIALLALTAAAACADSATPTAPRAETVSSISLDKVKKDKKAKVAVCKLQKEDWKTEQIGVRGGKVEVGGVSLVVPAGALRSTVSITAHLLPTTSASVQFLPEGLQFSAPATLTMQYTKCDTPVFGVNVVYVQADTVSEVEPSTNHPIFKYVTAKIGHFSSYAVAY
jgi:hypothetical protein